MRVTTAGSVRKASTTMGVAHLGQESASTCRARCNRRAHDGWVRKRRIFTGRCRFSGRSAHDGCCPELTTRSPRLLLRLPGSLLLRLAARTFLALLFHEPPRLTRLEPVSSLTARYHLAGIQHRFKSSLAIVGINVVRRAHTPGESGSLPDSRPPDQTLD